MTARDEAASNARRRIGAGLGLAAALAVAGAGLATGTWAAGGSDSSCYSLMADAFARGQVQPTTDLALTAPWTDASRSFAPAGFVPSPTRPGAASPICAPGFSLLLAPFRWLGGREAIFLVTPMAGGLLIWLTFLFGRQLAGPLAGAAAAIVTAAVPALLFQVVQPMNDVMVAALWMAVIVSASLPDPSRPWALGTLAGLAVLIRPNLAPSAVAVAVWLIAVEASRGGWSRRLLRAVTGFAVAALPWLAVLLVLNTELYGHPLRSGYGRPQDLFALSHLWPNLRQYGAAVRDTELGFPILGLAAALVAPRPVQSVVALALAVSGSVAAVYLFYYPFPEWWYLRFLLPALALLTVLACAVVAWLFEALNARLGQWVPGVLLMTLAVGVGAFELAVARERQAFDLHRIERRFRTTGDVVRNRLQADAVFLSVWESGTVRYHANRVSLLWDALAPGDLDRAVEWLDAQGLPVYIIIEQWEEPRFRERFAGHSVLANLDWPPRFEIERQVRIYRPTDRAVYAGGGRVPTELVISR